jgi:hypothetical protein
MTAAASSRGTACGAGSMATISVLWLARRFTAVRRFLVD